MRSAALTLAAAVAVGAVVGVAIAAAYVALGVLPPPEVPF